MSNQRLIEDYVKLARTCHHQALLCKYVGMQHQSKNAMRLRDEYMAEARQLKADATL